MREGHRAAEVKSQLETIGLKGEFSLKFLHTDSNFPDLSRYILIGGVQTELIFRSSGSSSV